MNPVLAKLIQQSVIKVPSVLGVDFLWDDQAALHEYGLLDAARTFSWRILEAQESS